MIQFTGRKVEVVTANQDFPLGYYSFQNTPTWSNARVSSGCGPSQPHSGHSQPWWGHQGSLRRDLLQHQGPRHGQDQEVFRGLQIQERHLVWVRQARHGESETLNQDTVAKTVFDSWPSYCYNAHLASPSHIQARPGQAGLTCQLVTRCISLILSASAGIKTLLKVKTTKSDKTQILSIFCKKDFHAKISKEYLMFVWCPLLKEFSV